MYIELCIAHVQKNFKNLNRRGQDKEIMKGFLHFYLNEGIKITYLQIFSTKVAIVKLKFTISILLG